MIPPAIQLLLVFILVVAAAGFPHFYRREGKEGPILALKAPNLIARQKAKKDTNKKRILDAFSAMPEGKLTNFDLEILLDVSDATATRYLEELENEGKIRKVGGIGRHVYYERIL